MSIPDSHDPAQLPPRPPVPSFPGAHPAVPPLPGTHPVAPPLAGPRSAVPPAPGAQPAVPALPAESAAPAAEAPTAPSAPEAPPASAHGPGPGSASADPAEAAPLIRSFTADGPIDVNIQHVRGNVTIRAEHGHGIRVELHPRGEAGRELASRMQIDFSGGHLRIDAPADEASHVSASFGDLFRGSGDEPPAGASFADKLGATLRTLVRSAGGIGSSLDIEVIVPTDSRAVASLAVGDIRASGRFGRVDLKGATGNVEVEEVDGESSVATGTGNVAIGVLRGQASATTGTGGVLVRRAERGTLRSRTGVGDIEVRVLEGTATRLDLASGLGRRSVDLTPTGSVAPETGRTLEIEARTGTGNIRIQRAER
ncbi:hypothetical protein [Brachybacterium hainanense]|uniref:Adhesin domain-containing protein n=1 Tax=Brachybacterium hainanense TaxID=1541174 RepID=A0ABV6RFW3_9MICO